MPEDNEDEYIEIEVTPHFGLWLTYHQCVRRERYHRTWAWRWGLLALASLSIDILARHFELIDSALFSVLMLGLLFWFTFATAANVKACVLASREANKVVGF